MTRARPDLVEARPVPDAAADGFAEAARSVVDYLARCTPLRDWSVSRVAGGEQVHLHVHPGGLIEVGDRVPWRETFCHRMVEGAPHVVPDALADPAYADLPAAGDIRAYVGFPITDDGELFGILCGVGSDTLPDLPPVDAELVGLLGRLLSAHLTVARAADREHRRATIATALAETDQLTGLVNRRGWDALVTDAQRRIDAFGDPVAVAVVDLDGLKVVNDQLGHAAGDELLRRTSAALRAAGTEQDRIARYGGDEFTILTSDVAVEELSAHYARFSDALAAEGIPASLGHAHTGPGAGTVVEAFRLADQSMYDVKRSRLAAAHRSAG